jgi:hypothetical protein
VQETEEASVGFKEYSDRVTALGLSTSAGTHKNSFMVISKSINPMCFKGVTVFPDIQYIVASQRDG